jgi:hypothetical protein
MRRNTERHERKTGEDGRTFGIKEKEWRAERNGKKIEK